MKAKGINKKLPDLEEFVGERLEPAVVIKALKKKEEEVKEGKERIDALMADKGEKKQEKKPEVEAVYGV